jgi:phospholipase/carboxylesterase
MNEQALLETIEIETTPSPTAAVIWMHGLGADGNDFAPIVRELDLAGCRGIRFVFPHAETMPVTINNGYVMRAWYDILGMDLVRREDAQGLRASQRRIDDLIEQNLARHPGTTHRIGRLLARVRHDPANRSALLANFGRLNVLIRLSATR